VAFPFISHGDALKQRILMAIGASGLAALGCGSATHDPGGEGQGAVTGVTAGAGGGAGGGGTTQSGTAGSGGAMASVGSAGSTAGTGGVGGSGGSEVVAPVDAGTPPADAAMATPSADASTSVVSCEFGGPVTTECASRAEMESKVRFGCGMIPNDPVPTDEEVAAAFLDDGCLPMNLACDGCCNPAAAPGVPMGDGSCCYTYCSGACCGRPFTVDGEARVAGVSRRYDWLQAPAATPAPTPLAGAELRQRIARGWLDDARMEHASIASFARFSLELLSFGAPADLVADAQRAGLDEVQHARDCFALAARFGGSELGPSPLPMAEVALAASLGESVRAAFLEGCLGETQAAALAAEAVALAEDPEVVRVLTKIAEDEARHAELAFRFVAWALEQEPALGAQLAALVTELGAADGRELPPQREGHAERRALHAAGRFTDAETARLMDDTLRQVVLPCAEALLLRQRAAA